MFDIAYICLGSQTKELKSDAKSGKFPELGRWDAPAPLLGGSPQKYLHPPTYRLGGVLVLPTDFRGTYQKSVPLRKPLRRADFRGVRGT